MKTKLILYLLERMVSMRRAMPGIALGRRRPIVALLTLGMVLLVACNGSLDFEQEVPRASELVTFDVGFGLRTKTTTDVNFKTSFVAGDTVGCMW